METCAKHDGCIVVYTGKQVCPVFVSSAPTSRTRRRLLTQVRNQRRISNAPGLLTGYCRAFDSPLRAG